MHTTRIRECVVVTLAGVLLALLLLEGGLRILGFASAPRQQRAALPAPRAGECVILCLGESSTALGGEDSYPKLLERLLNERGLAVRFTVVNGGLAGIDSPIIIRNLDRNLARVRPDIVTVMMGINDGKKEFLTVRPRREDQQTALLPQLKVFRLAAFLSLSLREWGESRERERELARHERSLVAQTRTSPGPEASIALSELYRRQGRYGEAEKVLLEAVREFPTDKLVYQLGKIYRDMGRTAEEEATFKRGIAEFPSSSLCYRGLARTWRTLGRDGEAEELLRREVERIPRALPCIELASFHLGRNDLDKAQQYFRMAIAREPNDYSYAKLAECARRRGALALAETMLRKAMELYESGEACMEMGLLRREEGRRSDAVTWLTRAVDLGPSRWGYRQSTWETKPRDESAASIALARVLEENGDGAKAREILRRVSPNPITFDSYATLVEKVTSRCGRLAAIQYPLRSLESLSAMVPQQAKGTGGIVLVDNEANFRRALSRAPYNTYFVDTYGGNFGHCTRAGNELIARAVADAIVAAWLK